MGTVLEALTEAQKFALTALLEVTPPATVGEFVGETDEGDSKLFECLHRIALGAQARHASTSLRNSAPPSRQ